MQLLFFHETEAILWFLHGSGCLNPNGGVRGGAGRVCVLLTVQQGAQREGQGPHP